MYCTWNNLAPFGTNWWEFAYFDSQWVTWHDVCRIPSAAYVTQEQTSTASAYLFYKKHLSVNIEQQNKVDDSFLSVQKLLRADKTQEAYLFRAWITSKIPVRSDVYQLNEVDAPLKFLARLEGEVSQDQSVSGEIVFLSTLNGNCSQQTISTGDLKFEIPLGTLVTQTTSGSASTFYSEELWASTVQEQFNAPRLSYDDTLSTNLYQTSYSSAALEIRGPFAGNIFQINDASASLSRSDDVILKTQVIQSFFVDVKFERDLYTTIVQNQYIIADLKAQEANALSAIVSQETYLESFIHVGDLIGRGFQKTYTSPHLKLLQTHIRSEVVQESHPHADLVRILYLPERIETEYTTQPVWSQLIAVEWWSRYWLSEKIFHASPFQETYTSSEIDLTSLLSVNLVQNSLVVPDLTTEFPIKAFVTQENYTEAEVIDAAILFAEVTQNPYVIADFFYQEKVEAELTQDCNVTANLRNDLELLWTDVTQLDDASGDVRIDLELLETDVTQINSASAIIYWGRIIAEGSQLNYPYAKLLSPEDFGALLVQFNDISPKLTVNDYFQGTVIQTSEQYAEIAATRDKFFIGNASQKNYSFAKFEQRKSLRALVRHKNDVWDTRLNTDSSSSAELTQESFVDATLVSSGPPPIYAYTFQESYVEATLNHFDVTLWGEQTQIHVAYGDLEHRRTPIGGSATQQLYVYGTQLHVFDYVFGAWTVQRTSSEAILEDYKYAIHAEVIQESYIEAALEVFKYAIQAEATQESYVIAGFHPSTGMQANTTQISSTTSNFIPLSYLNSNIGQTSSQAQLLFVYSNLRTNVKQETRADGSFFQTSRMSSVVFQENLIGYALINGEGQIRGSVFQRPSGEASVGAFSLLKANTTTLSSSPVDITASSLLNIDSVQENYVDVDLFVGTSLEVAIRQETSPINTVLTSISSLESSASQQISSYSSLRVFPNWQLYGIVRQRNESYGWLRTKKERLKATLFQDVFSTATLIEKPAKTISGTVAQKQNSVVELSALYSYLRADCFQNNDIQSADLEITNILLSVARQSTAINISLSQTDYLKSIVVQTIYVDDLLVKKYDIAGDSTQTSAAVLRSNYIHLGCTIFQDSISAGRIRDSTMGFVIEPTLELLAIDPYLSIEVYELDGGKRIEVYDDSHDYKIIVYDYKSWEKTYVPDGLRIEVYKEEEPDSKVPLVTGTRTDIIWVEEPRVEWDDEGFFDRGGSKRKIEVYASADELSLEVYTQENLDSDMPIVSENRNNIIWVEEPRTAWSDEATTDEGGNQRKIETYDN